MQIIRSGIIILDVLVSSLRVAKRLADLTPEEVSELFQMVVRVQKALETEHNCNSSTICVQDGVHSGQTVPVTEKYKHSDKNTIFFLVFVTACTRTYSTSKARRFCSQR